MARSKSKSHNSSDSYGGREANRFSSRRLPLRVNLKPIEDRRLFTPDPNKTPKTFKQRQFGLRVKGVPLVSLKRSEGYRYQPKTFQYEPLPYRLEFTSPRNIVLCARRKIRSEVMHALGLAGLKRIFRKSGAGSHNQWSKVSC